MFLNEKGLKKTKINERYKERNGATAGIRTRVKGLEALCSNQAIPQLQDWCAHRDFP